MFDARPRDAVSFGVASGYFSDDLKRAQRKGRLPGPPGGPDHETVIELTYRFDLRNGALFIQPDLQYIIQPGGTSHIKNALVLGRPDRHQLLSNPRQDVMTLLSILALGFFLGMRHATDSDHVIAVTTIVSQQRKIGSAALTGIFWGIGHSITLLIVGGAIILFGVVIPERLGMSLEFCVALMLILLGLLNLGSFRRSLNEVQLSEHSHPHGFYLRLRPVFVGVVHGLAGSAAVALLVLPLIREPGWATFYLLIFGAGTIAGMMLITVIVAVPITYSANRSSLLTAISAPRPARSV